MQTREQLIQTNRLIQRIRERIAMSRLVPAIMTLASIVGLCALFFVSGPKYAISSYTSTSIVTAINPELILDYNTYTATCANAATVCYQLVSPYTTTEIWSAESTFVATLLTTSTGYAPLAISEVGVAATILTLILLFSSVVLLARFRRHSCN